MKSQNNYIGDDKFQKMLEHYNCPTPVNVVKMRFIGAICSPNLELRPTDVISSFWPQGQSPRLETKDEADLFFKFFMGLWDECFEKVQQNKIALPVHKFKGKEELKSLCEARFAEIEMGFVEGFWGGCQDLKIPAYIAEIIDSITDVVCDYFNISKTDIIGKKKSKDIVEPRMIAIYLISEYLDIPLISIGKHFGGRDHTTIIHARDKITDLIKTDEKIKNIVTDLKSLITNS